MPTVIILAGVSGSGKSTIAAMCRGEVVSADHFFLDKEGVYQFDPAKLPEAHGWCLRRFVALLQDCTASVVVDNTNTTVAELAPYAALALAYGYDLRIVIVECDPRIAFERNKHGVPLASVEAQASRLACLAASLPPWWPVEVIKEG